MNNLIIRNIKCLVQVADLPLQVRKGKEMSVLPVIENAFIIIRDGRIEDFGEMKNFRTPSGDYEEMDATGRFVLPCWVDSHTHLVFAESRENEFVMKIRGASYEEIYENGGGILNSAGKLRMTSEESLLEGALQRLDEIIRLGTGAVEIKSGYGLSTESELKMLRVIKKIKEISPVPVRSTFLGAHAVPPEFRNNKSGYVDLIIHEMIPAVAGEGLADFVDVFCDKGFFTTDETAAILEEAAKYNIRPKIHANELDVSGGVQTGVKYNALSVDHLERMEEKEISCLSGSSTIPVVLPSTSFFLNIPYAPARQMIDSGLPVAIASDYNPGSSPSGNLNFSMSLACIKMKLLPEEAINAMTVNAAFALGVQNIAGAIGKGMAGNLIITKKINSLSFLPYSFGNPPIEKIITGGEIYQGIA